MNKEITRVLMLTTSFTPEPPGGAERQAEYLAEYLAHRGIFVTVLTRHTDSLPRFEKRKGFEIIRVPQFGPGKLKSFTFVIGLAYTILIQFSSFDILHAHLVYTPAFAAVLVGKLVGKRTIIRFRSSGLGSDLLKSNTSLRGRFRMLVLKHWADCFVVLTSEMKNELLEAGYDKNRIKIMRNGVDTEYFAPIAAVQSVDLNYQLERTTKIVYIGRFEKSKNLPLLLRAIKLSTDRCSNFILTLVGAGDEQDNLIDLADQLEICEYVVFAGQTQDVRSFLRQSDIFVLPSLDEGISNSLLEAMSCGLACISTDVGGASDLFDNGAYGILVNSNDEVALSDAIVQLVSDPGLAEKYGDAARQRVLSKYSISSVGESYIKLYNCLLGKVND